MPEHRIGTREEWQAARDELAGLEAEQAQRNEEIKSKRLDLPWVPVEKEYEFGTGPRVKNGPALAGHGAEAVRDAIAATITSLPGQLRRTLTWDRGSEMAAHADIAIQANIGIYFADPHSPWQRGTNENTNGLLRQYWPKGADLRSLTQADCDHVADRLNTRPRQTLNWQTPAQALDTALCATTT